MAQKKPIKQAPKKVIAPEKPARDYYLILLCIFIAVISIIRYRLISVPFERDEGEYGYIGNLFLHGVAPFKDAYSMKLPGTSFMYSILMLIFGHTSTGVHLGLIFVNAATIYFLFTGFKKIFNPFIALATALVYGFMAIGLAFDAFAAHATHFICFFSSIAILFLAQYIKAGKVIKVFLFGLMLGMAFLMKQQAVFLIIFGGLFLLYYLKIEKKQSVPDVFKKLCIYAGGVFIPYIIVVLITLATGQFKVFWLWTVRYASTYEAVKSFDMVKIMFNSSFAPSWDSFYLTWLLGVAGLVVLYWSPLTRLQKVFALLYVIACAGVLSSGFYFRQHYFIALLPALGLMTGVFLEFALYQIKTRFNVLKFAGASLVALLVVVVFTIAVNFDYYFNFKKLKIFTPNGVCKMAYWGNPFIEAQEISKYIAANTSDTDKIAVLGSEPEMYFYANRTSATGFLYTYPLVENQPFNKEMQQEMIDEIKKNKPAFIVFCNVTYSWLVQSDSPKDIFEWSNTYTHDNYTPVGFADFYKNEYPNDGWHFYWNADIANRTGKPDSFIIIFKRNPEKKA